MFGSHKYVLHIEGMMCQHCAAHVQEALEAIPGVKSAKIDLAAKKAMVKAEKELTKGEFEKAVSEAGYRLVEVTQ